MQVNTDTFVYTGLGLSARTDASGTTHFVRCSCGLLNDERTPDGKKYYYLFDGLGSIVGMTDSSGNEVNRYDYDPYGQVINQQEQSGLNNPWKFAGGYLDSSTSLYKFGTRYYDPSLGRWTQQDPAGAGYVYAGDNPVNVVDPSGRLNFIPIPGGLIINLTPQDIYNFQVNSGYIAAFLGFLSLTLPSLAPYAAAAGVVLAASVEIGLYSTAFCGGGSVNVTILYADLNGWTQSCA